MSLLYFMIVGRNDVPLFEADFVSAKASWVGTKPERSLAPCTCAPLYPRALAASHPDLSSFLQRDESRQYILQFVLHASLDVVDEVVWNSQAMNLKLVDRYNDMYVAAYNTAGNIRFLLLTDQKGGEDSMKNFFQVCCCWVGVGRGRWRGFWYPLQRGTSTLVGC